MRSLFAYLSSDYEKAITAPYRAQLGVTGQSSTIPIWGSPAKCFSQLHNLKIFRLVGFSVLFNDESQAGKLRLPSLLSLV